MTVLLSSQENLSKKLNSILNTAKEKNENGIVIMTNINWHMEVFNFFLKHKGINALKIGVNTFFAIKEMRIELKPIHYYV